MKCAQCDGIRDTKKNNVKRSSLLLAGGAGTRLEGRDKALIVYDQRTFIERTLDILDEVSEEVIVSLRDEEQLKKYGRYIDKRGVVIDTIKNYGPLAGMLAGFKKACGEYVFTVACDMPFLSSGLIDMMFEMTGEHDALIPVSGGCVKEPLHAVYSRKKMLEAIELSLDLGHRSILAAVSYLDDVLYMDVDMIKTKEHDLRSFININAQSDLSLLYKLNNHED